MEGDLLSRFEAIGETEGLEIRRLRDYYKSLDEMGQENEALKPLLSSISERCLWLLREMGGRKALFLGKGARGEWAVAAPAESACVQGDYQKSKLEALNWGRSIATKAELYTLHKMGELVEGRYYWANDMPEAEVDGHFDDHYLLTPQGEELLGSFRGPHTSDTSDRYTWHVARFFLDGVITY